MKKSLLILAVMALGLFNACQSESREGIAEGAGDLTLRYNIPGVGSGETRASTVPAEPGEAVVNSMFVLFFEYSSGETGTYLDYYEVPVADLPVNTSGTIEVKFRPGSTLSNTGEYSLLLVANLEDYINESVDDWLLSLAGKTEFEVIESALVYAEGIPGNAETWDAYIPVRQDNLLMSAQAAKGVEQSIVDVNFTRGVARFDVSNQATDYILETASVWNAFTRQTIWASNFNDYINPPRTQRFYGITTNADNEVKGGLYAYENSVSSPELDDKVTTCLILGIRHKNDAARTYYRVNVHPEFKGQHLRRNNVYDIIVQRVRGVGAVTEMDAYTSQDLFLDIRINDWFKDENGSIQYDGENILAVPVTNIVFTPIAETRTYDIFTLGEGTLEISKLFLPNGITATLSGKTLTVSATASQDTKSGYLEIRFGNLRITINVSQTGALEEYLTLDRYTIPAFGFESGNGMLNPLKVTSSGPWHATIYNGTYFTFQSGSTVTEMSGDNGDTFTVTTREANGGPASRFSFVHIILKDNPEISRTVVLEQKGTGGIDVLPAPLSVTFDPDGNAINNNTFTVAVETPAVWEVVKTGQYADKFSVTPLNNESDPTTPNKQITITAFPNMEPGTISATVRVRLKAMPTVFKDITVSQTANTLSINPTTVASISYTGGSTQAITVTSSAPWKAEIEMEGGGTVAYFNNTPGTTQITGNSGGTFTVTYPRLNAINVSHTAKVTVSINGVDISQTLQVVQTKIPAVALTIQSYDRTYHTVAGTPSGGGYLGTFYRFHLAIQDQTLYGPNGTVPTAATAPVFTSGTSPSSSATIYNYNWLNFSSSSARTNERQAIYNWRNGGTNRWVMANILGGANGVNYSNAFLRGISSSFTASVSSAPASTAKTIEYRRSGASGKVWDYIMDGPFGKITDPNALRLYTTDNINSSITAYPSTTVPLVTWISGVGTRHVQVAIDPVLKMLIIGDHEIWSYYSQTNPQSGSQEWIFMNNIIAFMMNAAQYDEEFLRDFKD